MRRRCWRAWYSTGCDKGVQLIKFLLPFSHMGCWLYNRPWFRWSPSSNMLDAIDAGLLTSMARVRPSMSMVCSWQRSLPLADACGFGRYTSHFVFSTPFAGEGIPYPSLSCLHCDDGVGRRGNARRGLVGKSDHAKTESDSWKARRDEWASGHQGRAGVPK